MNELLQSNETFFYTLLLCFININNQDTVNPQVRPHPIQDSAGSITCLIYSIPCCTVHDLMSQIS